jgi:hypothetical protein
MLDFWELILGYVIPLDWYPYFMMGRLYMKCPSISTLHSLDHDLNLKILKGKCIKK